MMKSLGTNRSVSEMLDDKLNEKLMVKALFTDPKCKTIKAIQTTIVQYMVNPMNLASLKFSGKFLVFTAYSVHSEMRSRFH